MAMKRCSAFPKAPASLEPYHQIVLCHMRTLIGGGGCNPDAGGRAVYTTPPHPGTLPPPFLGANLAPPWGGGVLPLCRGAVGVFNSPC